MPIFDADFLQKLEFLSLVSRRVYHGQMLAQRSTRQLGSGIEFADHQAYVPGDDFRYLDWNAFARHGELLLKRFHEERDLQVDLLVDCSRSMSVGMSPSKFDYARRVAACLAYIALAQLDRVSVSAFADRPLASFPVTRGKQQVLRLLRFLEGLSCTGEQTSLDAAAAELTQRDRTGGLAVLISDFFDPQGFRRALDRLRYQQFEVYLVQLFDPDEADPPLLGDLELVDAETGARRRVTVRQRDVQRYHQTFQRFLDSLQAYARHHGLGYLRTSTQVPYDELMLKVMRQAGWLSGA
jgi:uncharacterized protein (DUF58 family)